MCRPELVTAQATLVMIGLQQLSNNSLFMRVFPVRDCIASVSLQPAALMHCYINSCCVALVHDCCASQSACCGIDSKEGVYVQAANDAMREALKPEDLQQYAIMGRDADFEQALPDGSVPASGIVNVKSSEARAAADKGKPQKEGKLYKKDGKNQRGQKHQSAGGRVGQQKKRKT